MPVRNLDKIFKPRRIAVIGATDDHTKPGHTVLLNLKQAGFQGEVYPVNSHREAVQGIRAYKSVQALPQPADLAVICTPAATVPEIVRQCGESGIRGIIIISAGFREVGSQGLALEQQTLEIARQFDGLRIIGPNCLGMIAPRRKLNASFAAGTPKTGRIAFLSQSGALCTSVLDWALEADIGFSYFVSVGNILDVSIADLIDYFAADPDTEALILYIESLKTSREFMSAARAFARAKPIVAYKAGRFAESARAAASHTGALAGVDAVYEAAFQRAGIVRVFDVEDLFDCAELLAQQPAPRGARLAIVTNAGGPGVMATDALIARGGVLAALADETRQRLDTALPPFWSHGNPVDILGDAPAERYARAVEIVLEDAGVDALLVILTPQAITEPTETADLLAQVATKSSKPVLAAWMGGRTVRPGIERLQAARIATYSTPEQAVRAFMHLVSYARNLEVLYEVPRDVPLTFTLDRAAVRQQFETSLVDHGELLSEQASKRLLEGYGIPTTLPFAARSANEAVQRALEIGYPVVLKILSPQITHKTDVGGVTLNLKTDDEVRGAFARILESAHRARPDAQLDGVTVQRMVAAGDGFEMILGAKKDPVFGPVVLVGMGGVAAEVFQDRALNLPPLNERLARRMLESLRTWPLLQGYRGRAAANLDRLIEILMRFSYLIADYPEIREADVNPLLVTSGDIVALDARVIVDQQVRAHEMRPYEHLAIRPYPQEYQRSIALKDGMRVRLRPIKPEDEPLWHALLASCSMQSIWFRFGYLFKETTHAMASRFCYIDYDREMAIVAEAEVDGHRKLLGVARLVADADHNGAEFAVLVADAFQGRGLGSALLEFSLEIAQQWRLRRICAETRPDNHRMLATFRKWGFALDQQMGPDVVVARRELN